MSTRKHVIKKYANRKLYDTETSRYITLEGISELVRQGHDIHVLERDTGRDITPLILSQIVMGVEKRGEPGPAENLQERGQALLGYMRRTLKAPAALVSSEVERRRTDLEDLVDGAVERALARLSIPSRRDVDLLNRRLDQLERQLSRARAKPPAAKAVAAAPAVKASRRRTAAVRT